LTLYWSVREDKGTWETADYGKGGAGLALGSVGAETLSNATIPVGIAQTQDEDSLDKLLVRSDATMYRAKDSGRDCISTDLD